MLAGAVAVLFHYTETYNTQHGYKYTKVDQSGRHKVPKGGSARNHNKPIRKSLANYVHLGVPSSHTTTAATHPARAATGAINIQLITEMARRTSGVMLKHRTGMCMEMVCECNRTLTFYDTYNLSLSGLCAQR